MKCVIVLLFLLYFINEGLAGFDFEEDTRTIHGNLDPPLGAQRTYVINSNYEDDGDGNNHRVHKRSVVSSGNDSTIIHKINYLNDTHKQLMVHWVGEGSNVIICLARDPKPTSLPGLVSVGPSAVYISYDYGDTYIDKTNLFKLTNGSVATLEKFYNHPTYNTHLVFTDVIHNVLYVTTNHGRDIEKIDLNFNPSDISFHEFQPSVFVVLDKNDPTQKLYITEDFGKTFRNVQEFVKSFYWIKDDVAQRLLVQRIEPSGLSTILHSSKYFLGRVATIYATDVKDFFIKGDYLFITKVTSKGGLELYVSNKLGKPVKCAFDSADLEHKSYFIVDVTSNRALVAVSHSEQTSHLYVSENLDVENQVKFTLSLEDLLCYFPNSTWHESWIQHVAEEAFADIYKVDGFTGIYIASRVLLKPLGNNLGPQHLASVITFNHGRSWRLITAPDYDIEGQPNSCSINNNCSLHLSQKFSQLYPDTRSISILSSKSAPGVIIATGVLGKSLKGHYGVYISTDAGLTWRQTLRDLYFFNMGDHGGVLVAVTYFKSRGETRHVLYSTDEGETWKESAFHNEDIRLYGLMTEPGENTTVFTMFGSLPDEHQWMIVKLDLIKAFKYNCTKDDYKTWSPSQSDENRSYIPCVLGQQVTYERRMAHANCYNGLNYDTPISMKPCECDIYDYECDFGFIRNEKPGNCVRNTTTDPYKVPADCKPGTFYNRTKGYRKIQGDVCVNGFKNHYQAEEIPCPFNEVQDFLLFAQRERITRFNLVTRTLEELPIKKLKNVIAIDFDTKNNCVYWADIAVDTIGRQCLDNQSEPEILVSSDLASIEGMALDWISNTLYFVDGMRSKIELIRTDVNHSGRMRRTVLGPSVLKKPRGIAVHPKAGYMFWTDWSVENPSVNRANLDGSNISKLFGRSKVEWPNGVTIDYIAERIYWVDARQDYIASSDLHGDYFKLIISNEDVVSHPFAVAVFKNNMYWDDWKRNAIFSADKDSFKGVEVLQKQLPGLMDLKVYAHGIQIGTNECSNSSKCEYICVGGPKGKHTCLCPDGMDQTNGKCLCPGGVVPFVNFTCPKIQNSCSTDHFSCGNGFCVPKGWRCDGEDDCGDNSDEVQCGMQTCPSNYFVCGDGKCLPQYWKCDYDADCSDGSDELNCPKQNCTDGQFTCKNGRCIAAKWKCDGENDCKDGSDEVNCEPAEPQKCKDEEFHCKTGGLACIPPTWRCDGERDCRDGSDEYDCNNNTCLDIQFSCGPPQNRCIYSTWVCDGDKDCPDGRDEKNCNSTAQFPIQHNITDQFISKNGTCLDMMFQCFNKKCIPYWWKCDNTDDCGDGSDEIGCNKLDPVTVKPSTTSMMPTPKLTCGANQYQCSSGACILQSWVCDGIKDCPGSGAEDELNCENVSNCKDNQFKCRVGRSCIPLSAVCDFKVDCPDGTDEWSCEHNLPNFPATPSCSVGYFPCDGNSCHPLATLCDGKLDCKDGYDEGNCSKTQRVYQVLQMGVDERGVNDSSLFLYWWIPNPNNVTLEFMPSINKAFDAVWQNKSWTNNTEYAFTELQPFTKYNMTIYVRVKDTETVFPPAKYFVANTAEGVPTPPLNVTAKQNNGSHVLISWQKPVHANGLITNYQICWYPPLPPIKLKLSGNETAHLLPADFQPNVTYTFYVIAYNRKKESQPSAVTTLIFDGDSNLHPVQSLKVDSENSSSVTLSWGYSDPVDGFKITIKPESSYPRLPERTTEKNNITIDKLAPGVGYKFIVAAYKKSFVGPETQITAATRGKPLPDVKSLIGFLLKKVGTTVKLSWLAPTYSDGADSWTYGVYYGINEEELFEKPRLETTNLTALIENLTPCEIYTFTVGLVGPLGYGPLSKSLVEITTTGNNRAPPKNVHVRQDVTDPLKIRVEWLPACPATRSSTYIIRVRDTVKDHTSYIRTTNSSEFFHLFTITYGAIYNISIATADPDAMYSPGVVYHAPPILPPYEVETFVESNGSFIVYWQERDMPKEVGDFLYEVLVSPGNELNETTAETFRVKKAPFIYTNFTSGMYTFAVRVTADNGYRSFVSEKISMKTSFQPISGTSLSLILGVSALVIVLMIAVLVLFVVRHRRLQNSFTRFANSHYDTRSGAATFDDNGLEEEECPQITRFSDDEPLVIA